LIEGDDLVEVEDDIFNGISENNSGTESSGIASEESD
jgi:hypothetical protein